jgi:hypothetical protein
MTPPTYDLPGLDCIVGEVHALLRQLDADRTRPAWTTPLLFVYQDIELEAQQHRERLPAMLGSPDLDTMLAGAKLLGALIERFGYMKQSVEGLLLTAETLQSV